MNDIIDLINQSGFCEAEKISDYRFSMKLTERLPKQVLLDKGYIKRMSHLKSLYAYVASLNIGIKLPNSPMARAAVKSYLDYTAEIMKKTA